MVAATQTTSAPPAQKSQSPGASNSAGSPCVMRSALRGQSFADQENALAPRESKRVQRAVQLSEAEADAPSPSPEDTQVPSALDEAMARWKPRIIRVTDPVAMMSNAGYNIAIKGGTNLHSDAGFFGVALGEVAALQAEMTALAQAGPEGLELQGIAAMLGTWSGVYRGIRDTGMDAEGAADAAQRAKVYGRVRTALDTCGESVRGLVGSALVGMDVVGKIGASWDEVSMFVDAWGSSGGIPGASPYMWGAFLQTLERYRQILNQYDELEARGGDATDTAKMQVKDSDNKRGMVSDKDRYQEVSAAKGGNMALALETYDYLAANIVACQEQVEAMLARVEAGEFTSADEAVKAFRSEIGAGLGSKAFYKNVELLARGAWQTQAGSELITEGDQEAAKAYKMYMASQESSEQSADALGSADEQHGKHTAAAGKGDAHTADARWEAVKRHRMLANQYADEALAAAQYGDKKLGYANERYAMAEVELANAKLNLEGVDVATFPHLAPGVRATESKVAAARQRLSESKDNAERIKLIGDEVKQQADAAKLSATEYRPEKEEVPIPAKPDDEEGVEVNHFQKFSFGASIKPHPIVTIKFSTSGEWGQIFKEGKKGKVTNYTENKVSGAIELNLFLLTLEGGYEAKDRYEVDSNGVLGYSAVEKRGADEKTKWQAAKEIKDSGAEERLVKAFDEEQAQMATFFAAVHEAAATYRETEDRIAFMATVDSLLPDIDKAHGNLKFSVLWRGGGDLIDRCAQAGKLPSPEVMKEEVKSITRTEPELMEPLLNDRKAAHDAVIIGTRNESQRRFREAAGFKNDENVRFKSTGTAWFGAKAELPGGGFGYKDMYATTVSDGKGEEFDFETKQTYTREYELKQPGFTGTLSMSDDKDGMEIELDVKLRADLGDGEKQKELHSGVRKELRAAITTLKKGGSLMDIAGVIRDTVVSIITSQVKALDVSATPKSGLSLLLGAKLVLPNEGSPSGSVSIGTVRDIGGAMETNAFSFEAKHEGGMKVTAPLF